MSDTDTVLLGRTGLTVNRNGFGALPIQRVTLEESDRILRHAFAHGINFYDTARAYTDSEEKLGHALHDVRHQIVLATKTMALTPEGIRTDIEESLKALRTDYIDIYQLHNPTFCPKPEDGTGVYEALCELRQEGKIRFISITNHRVTVAREAVESGLYDTLQFPFSYLSNQADEELADLCRERNIGFIAMKALSGGLITNSAAAYAYLARFDHVVPIWGIQRMSELEEFLSYSAAPPLWDAAMQADVEHDRQELSGSFCRGCGYCLPCPAGIEINNCARMSLLLRRAPSANWLTPEYQEKMGRIADCVHCGHCTANCPYGLDTPALLQENRKDYQEILAGKPL